ncbi:IS481 family transposase [bacterium]|nr:IS481 family transposase [bacterium]
MPWKEVNLMSLRSEFIYLASQEDVCMNAICRRYNISTKTGYKWLHRYQKKGTDALRDLSRRPRHSPNQTSSKIEDAIVRLREIHPAWGARKLRRRLEATQGGHWPSVSTITSILHRHGCIDPLESTKHKAWQRFEATTSNDLWQMDFKGHFPIGSKRCHPLTILDDHSRFNLGLYACVDQTRNTVEQYLTAVFRRYGLPVCIITDNGSPWGTLDCESYTGLNVWLMRLGVIVSHSRPRHPQTMGKDERFHRTLKAEAITGRYFNTFFDCQQHFERWRMVYNLERPHEALGGEVPASRYQISQRIFPESLPAIEYNVSDPIRKVQINGEIYFHNRVFKIGKAFRGLPVALKPTQRDGVFDVFFMHSKISEIDLNDKSN